MGSIELTRRILCTHSLQAGNNCVEIAPDNQVNSSSMPCDKPVNDKYVTRPQQDIPQTFIVLVGFSVDALSTPIEEILDNNAVNPDSTTMYRQILSHLIQNFFVGMARIESQILMGNREAVLQRFEMIYPIAKLLPKERYGCAFLFDTR
jgi:hypothetical protein